jgi:GNAT superfamily N-acetyltransferase
MRSADGVSGSGLAVANGDDTLNDHLLAKLRAYNIAASGCDNQRGLTAQVRDSMCELVAGASGWSWRTCARIDLLWVRADARRRGWGTRLLDVIETEARSRGCRQVVLSTFTFQAPDFHRRRGYVETGRTEGRSSAARRQIRG